jgi:SAM-dependent methyltransferase
MDPDKIPAERVKTRWSEKWAERPEGPGAIWRDDEAPAAVHELIEREDLPTGAALDVGCGDGLASFVLAKRFAPTIGIDIAYDAVRLATEGARRDGSPARFVAGDVTTPPFPDAAFSLLFDRGCFHKLPQPLHAPYFEAMDRILRPGGLLFLMAASHVRRKRFSKRALRKWLFRLLKPGRAGHGFSESEIRSLAPSSLGLVEVRREEHSTRLGTIYFNRYLFRKHG